MDYLSRIIRESIEAELRKARKSVDTSPSEEQIKAGNYSKGHIKILGFNITIENPKGSYRKGKDRNGKEWKTLMHNDYGYFVRTLGKDGDAIDVFIGPNLKSTKIFPIDQYVNGEFDETKVMLGFDSKEEAKKAYLSNYEKDWKGFKYITEVGIDEFKQWLYDGKKQRKPFAQYKTLTESMILNEKFSSPLLAKYAKEHGGIEISRNGGLRDGAHGYHGGSGVDISKITDDMLEGEPFEFNWLSATPEQHNNHISFNDGYAVMIKPYDLKRDDNIDAPKAKGGERKLSRYGTGIGDTGDHDKSRGGWVGNGKDQLSAPYNGFATSNRAGEAQNFRNAWNNNAKDIDYIKNHKEDYKDWPERIRRGEENIRNIKNYARELQSKPRMVSEAQLRQIIKESLEKLLIQ